MSCRYEILNSSVGLLDRIEEASSGLRLTVSRLGAEPVSLSLPDKDSPDGSRHGFLWRDGEVEKPVSGWGNHATVMGYFVHRLWNQESVYEGHPIKGGTHGFLRHHQFGNPVVDLDKGSITYRVEPSEIPSDAYPYQVALKLA